MQPLLDVIYRRESDSPEAPVCPDHHVEMQIRGKLGKPTRFAEQAQAEYTMIYFCPTPGCNHTELRPAVRTQIPVPGEAPDRPVFARPGNRSSL